MITATTAQQPGSKKRVAFVRRGLVVAPLSSIDTHMEGLPTQFPLASSVHYSSTKSSLGLVRSLAYTYNMDDDVHVESVGPVEPTLFCSTSLSSAADHVDAAHPVLPLPLVGPVRSRASPVTVSSPTARAHLLQPPGSSVFVVGLVARTANPKETRSFTLSPLTLRSACASSASTNTASYHTPPPILPIALSPLSMACNGATPIQAYSSSVLPASLGTRGTGTLRRPSDLMAPLRQSSPVISEPDHNDLGTPFDFVALNAATLHGSTTTSAVTASVLPKMALLSQACLTQPNRSAIIRQQHAHTHTFGQNDERGVTVDQNTVQSLQFSGNQWNELLANYRKRNSDSGPSGNSITGGTTNPSRTGSRHSKTKMRNVSGITPSNRFAQTMGGSADTSAEISSAFKMIRRDSSKLVRALSSSSTALDKDIPVTDDTTHELVTGYRPSVLPRELVVEPHLMTASRLRSGEFVRQPSETEPVSGYDCAGRGRMRSNTEPSLGAAAMALSALSDSKFDGYVTDDAGSNEAAQQQATDSYHALSNVLAKSPNGSSGTVPRFTFSPPRVVPALSVPGPFPGQSHRGVFQIATRVSILAAPAQSRSTLRFVAPSVLIRRPSHEEAVLNFDGLDGVLVLDRSENGKNEPTNFEIAAVQTTSAAPNSAQAISVCQGTSLFDGGAPVITAASFDKHDDALQTSGKVFKDTSVSLVTNLFDGGASVITAASVDGQYDDVLQTSGELSKDNSVDSGTSLFDGGAHGITTAGLDGQYDELKPSISMEILKVDSLLRTCCSPALLDVCPMIMQAHLCPNNSHPATNDHCESCVQVDKHAPHSRLDTSQWSRVELETYIDAMALQNEFLLKRIDELMLQRVYRKYEIQF